MADSDYEEEFVENEADTINKYLGRLFWLQFGILFLFGCVMYLAPQPAPFFNWGK